MRALSAANAAFLDAAAIATPSSAYLHAWRLSQDRDAIRPPRRDFLATVCLAETVSDWLFRSLVQVQRVLGTEGVDGSFRLPAYQHT
jgi:hypothetical protein